jgi:hypothetical protein
MANKNWQVTENALWKTAYVARNASYVSHAHFTKTCDLKKFLLTSEMSAQVSRYFRKNTVAFLSYNWKSKKPIMGSK